MATSVFRFVRSNRRSQYGVWRGEERIGFVTKIVHRHTDRGITRTIVTGWTPSTLNGSDLATERTREAAASALWFLYQKGHR